MNYEQKLNVYLTHIEQRLFLKDRRTDKNFKCFLTRASFSIEDVKNMLTYILIKYFLRSLKILKIKFVILNFSLLNLQIYKYN